VSLHNRRAQFPGWLPKICRRSPALAQGFRNKGTIFASLRSNIGFLAPDAFTRGAQMLHAGIGKAGCEGPVWD